MGQIVSFTVAPASAMFRRSQLLFASAGMVSVAPLPESSTA